MNAKEALHWMENDTGIMSCNDDAWPIALRALRLLAAAERNDGSTPETDVAGLVKVMREAAADYMLCYTPDGDVDQARLRDNANYFGMHYNAAAIALESLAARVGELEKDAESVDFYEREFYPLSNFSAFTLVWKGIRFDTSEAAYHWEKFTCDGIRALIQFAPSAHAAFKIAESERANRRPDWDAVKVGIMRDILRAKAGQHEYVRRKLLETGTRPLIEKSWRDDFWGWGPNKDGQNMLGKLWMEIRADLAATDSARKP